MGKFKWSGHNQREMSAHISSTMSKTYFLSVNPPPLAQFNLKNLLVPGRLVPFSVSNALVAARLSTNSTKQ